MEFYQWEGGRMERSLDRQEGSKQAALLDYPNPLFNNLKMLIESRQ